MRPRPSSPLGNPMMTSLLVLLVVLVVESLLLAVTRPLLFRMPELARWGVTFILLGVSFYTAWQTRWLRPVPRPNWWRFGAVTLLVLFTVQTLGDRVRELPSPYGWLLALLLALGVGYLLWRNFARLGQARAWLAGLAAVAVFITLYPVGLS